MPLVGGQRTEINAIAEHPVSGEIYAVGRRFGAPFLGGAPINHFVAKWTASPGPGCVNPPGPITQFPNAEAVYAAYDGTALGAGVVSFNDVAIELGGVSGLEVAIVGTAKSGTGDNKDKVRISSIDESLGAVPAPTNLNLGFGSLNAHAQGLSLAIDDGTGGALGLGTRYVGAHFTDITPEVGDLTTPESELLNFAIVDGAVTTAYEWTWSLPGGDPAAAPQAHTGFFGMTQDGLECFMSGGIKDEIIFAGFYESFVANVDCATGAAVAWAVALGGAFNYYSKGNAAVPGFGVGLDDSYTAGSIDNFGGLPESTLTQGALAQHGPGGGIIAFRSSACTAVEGEDTDGKAVALHDDLDVSVGGSTNAGPGEWAIGGCPDGSPGQPLSAVDAIYGGSGLQSDGPPSDGYIFRDESPVGGP